MRTRTYAFQEGREGSVKIGQTDDVKKRKVSIQTGNPNKLRFLGYLDVTEEEAHRSLARFKTSSEGEWFHFTPEVIQYLKDHGIKYCTKPWCGKLIAAEPEKPSWPKWRCEDKQCRKIRRAQPNRKSSKRIK